MRKNAVRIASLVGLFLAAIVAGFLVSSKLGEDMTRLEVERLLARVLRGEVAIESARLVLTDGLWLKGEGFKIYPAKQGARAGQATLSGERVSARLDPLALLRGKFRLLELNVEGLHLRLERFPDGSWSLPPLQALQQRRKPTEPGDLEPKLAILKVSEIVTRTLLTRPLVAVRVQLHQATVTFVDHLAGAADDPPLTLRLRGIEARLEHDWLASTADLTLRGQLTDAVGRRTRVEIVGRKRDDQSLTIAVTDLPTSALAPYLAGPTPGGAADGTLSGSVAYRTPTPQHGVLQLDWLIRNLNVAIPLREEPLQIEIPRLHLRSRIEIHPGRLRLTELELEGLGDARQVGAGQASASGVGLGASGIGLVSASGIVERPLRNSALAKLSINVHNTGLSQLRRIVSWLPETDAQPLTQVLARLESGRIDRIRASGGARVSQWRRLVQGELQSLPQGFTLAADVADVDVATEGPAALTDLRAHAEWSGDRIALRQMEANWDGGPLPRIDASIEGVSRLLSGLPSTRELKPGAKPLPGLGTLWSVLTGGGRGREDSSTTPAPPLPELQLAIEALDHPVLRWPIRNTQVRLEPTPYGVVINASEGTWAGSRFRAEALWVREPAPHWSLAIAVIGDEAPPETAPSTATPVDRTERRTAARDEQTWFRGHVSTGSLEAAGLPSSGVQARFDLTGNKLTLSDITGQLTPRGTLSGSLVVDLSTRDRLAVNVDAEITAGDLAQIAPLVGLGREQWSGELSFRAGLSGWVYPEKPLLAELSGPILVLAREGELRREIPMGLALAQATEGFNPFSSRDVARYESISMKLQLDHGRLSTDDLTLEGPVRVYASGFLDVARPEPEVNAVVGVFLFRQADRTLGRIPLLAHLVSGRGLVGGYFELTGSAEEPEIRGLAIDSLSAAIPDILKAPFRALNQLGRLLRDEAEAPTPAKPAPEWFASPDEWLRKAGHTP